MKSNGAVLLVDDDRDIVRGTSLRLRAAGYDVLTAYDGEAGLQAAHTQYPHAIVLDVRMPSMNGLEVLRALKADESTRRIPVMMLSASLVDEAAALDAGARFFLRKPYDAASLVSAVRTMFDEQQNT